ncbi:hypothetical protein ACPV38_02840 [Photobacterium damselae]|uniref:hypothetical protein n=1 Tax=Photobacterium damselae TaxID=38293 RepID=UPI004068B3FC
MLHKANDYIRHHIIVGDDNTVTSNTAVVGKVFTTQQLTAINVELIVDAKSYLYSSVISFLDALQGVKAGFYSWPTVQLYYSIFYALRADLAFNNNCLFYVGTKPYSINVSNDISPRKEKGNTHKVVLDMFKKNNPGHVLLSQDIDMTSPFEWFIYNREFCNYKNPKFSEPITPSYWKMIEQHGIRNCLRDYFSDLIHLRTFDKDHAIVAYPYQLIKMVLNKLTIIGVSFDDAEMENIFRIMLLIDNINEFFPEFDFSDYEGG